MREDIYRVSRPIHALGAKPGDRLIIRRSHSEAPILVVRQFGHVTLAELTEDGVFDSRAEFERSIPPSGRPKHNRPDHLRLVRAEERSNA